MCPSLQMIFCTKKDQHVFHRSERRMILACRISGSSFAFVASKRAASFIIHRDLTNGAGRR